MSEHQNRLDSGGLTYLLQRIKTIFTSMFQAKEAGKGLSTNDYTNAEKTKLAGIAEGATANVGTVTGITMNSTSKTVDANGVVDLGTVITEQQDISGKADKDTDAVVGNFASFDASGNPVDSGHKHSDYITNVSDKADKVASATSGHFAGLDSNGNLTDSGVSSSDFIASSLKGSVNGVAELNANGIVPSSQLPSYVDDVVDGYFYDDKFYEDEEHTIEIPGESGKIYVDLSTNKTYRWSGTVFVVIASDLALGETDSTAYRGDRGAAAYAAAVTNVDSTPTSGSGNLVTSGGVYTAMDDKADKTDTVLLTTLSMGRKANTAVGVNSTALGSGVTSSGSCSYAEGNGTTASNSNAHAEGAGSTASGYASHAEGASTTASASYSHVEGTVTTASGQCSHAEGAGTLASGTNSHAEGSKDKTTSTYNGFTYTCGATGRDSHAEGFNTIADSSQSHAEGSGTMAIGAQAHAEGNGTVAYEAYAHAEGYGGSYTRNNVAYISGAKGVADHTEGYQCLTNSGQPGNHAEGYQTQATGGAAHAEGAYTIASGAHSHAEGNYTTASNIQAHAEGTNTVASGQYAHAEGLGGTYTRNGSTYISRAQGTADHTEGYQCRTESNMPGNHAEGYMTAATGGGAHSEGAYTIAAGLESHAEGCDTKAENNASHAEGIGSYATGTASHVFGTYNITDYGSYPVSIPSWVSGTSYSVGDVVLRSSYIYVCKTANSDTTFTSSNWTISDVTYSQLKRYAEIAGNGYSSNTRANIRALDWAGNEYLKGDLYVNCDATSMNGIKVPKSEDAVFTGTFSHNRKSGTTVGTLSVALGNDSTASGASSVAEGYYTTASGVCSHAAGASTTASGSYSHAEGYGSTASGMYSHVEGGTSSASGDYSHAEGNSCSAAKVGSHAEGYYSTASGDYSHAEGYHAKATGDYSHAEGNYVNARGVAETVTGKYNCEEADAWDANTSYTVGDFVIYNDVLYKCKIDNPDSPWNPNNWQVSTKFIDVVGNGTGASNLRSNARALDVDGNEYLKGDLYVGCNADSTGGTKVAKISDIPDISGKIDSSEKGAANGVAELDANGLVPTSQLPSYVDDVLEYANTSAFPATGETGKIYIALDTNKTYRWSGSEYVEISASLALGETSSTAYRGDRGATAYSHATDSSRLTTAQSSGLYKFATTAEGHVASVTTVQKSDITALGIPAQDTTYESKNASSGGTDVSLVTTGEKYTWNQKYDKPSGGIPGTDLADSYIKEPSTDGTSGQVLTTDGQGGRTWQTVQGGGTGDYTNLTNKPSINSVTLSGNKTSADLGVLSAPSTAGTSGQVLTSDGQGGQCWATISELPAVTSSDNGKFLTVVNGAWTATTMQAWQGGSY